MIPFPKLHIAESVLNRIHNTMDGKASLGELISPPIAPDPLPLGLAIDEEVQNPAAPTEVPPAQQESADSGAIENSLTGGSPFDGAVAGALAI